MFSWVFLGSAGRWLGSPHQVQKQRQFDLFLASKELRKGCGARVVSTGRVWFWFLVFGLVLLVWFSKKKKKKKNGLVCFCHFHFFFWFGKSENA